MPRRKIVGAPEEPDGASCASLSSRGLGDKADILSRMQENIDIILATNPFKDIKEMEPLSVSDGGSQHPYKKEYFKQCAERNDAYQCGINLLDGFQIYGHAWSAPSASCH